MRSCAALCFLVFALTAVVSAQDTVEVKSGWNIIGSVKAGAVPDVLSTDPPGLITTAFYGYEPGAGYETSDTLKKGLGYWVKASADGIVVFNNSPDVDVCKSQAFVWQGRFYNTVRIGDQCWMAQNLDAGTMIAVASDQTNNAVLEKYCYDDDPVNCTLYGGLYQWNEAMQYVTTPGAQGICPAGWHIPTDADLQILSSTVGDNSNALKALGVGSGTGAGTNTSGFSALLAGAKYIGPSFFDIGNFTYFWSSTEFDATNAACLGLYVSNNAPYPYSDLDKGDGFSVRCLKD